SAISAKIEKKETNAKNEKTIFFSQRLGSGRQIIQSVNSKPSFAAIERSKRVPRQNDSKIRGKVASPWCDHVAVTKIRRINPKRTTHARIKPSTGNKRSRTEP